MEMKKMIFVAFLLAFALSFIHIVAAQKATVCCEKTISGLYCQDVPAEECAPEASQVPTRCDYTSYCRPGICFSSTEGTCTPKTSEFVCKMNGGIWSITSPPQCELGCCVLADQAAFVTLTRCKKLSAFLGLETNFKSNIKDEVQCILSVQGQEKGACVYEEDFQKKCKFTTRADCTGVSGNDKTKTFFKGKLCSAEELGTICGPTTNTTICAPGKEEVYFVDTCGNIANIYDYNRRNDPAYWADVIEKTESCNPNSANANSATCGNCNYLLGTFCRSAESAGKRATIGDYICADLNCKKTSNGKSYKHGESWCVYKDAGKTGEGNNAVGSRFYKHICINGEEILEQCDDYRAQECIEATISTSTGTFSQAACRVNRWRDCVAQTSQIDCENSDRRDCKWIASVNACAPKNSPGLNFWEEGEASAICAQANAICEVKIEKDLFGKEKVVGNKECLEGGWLQARINYCMALGDCGPKVNWMGDKGYEQGYTYSAPKID